MRAIIVVAFIVALITMYPYISNISTASSLKGSYVFKWSEIPVEKRGTIYKSDLNFATKFNNAIKILLEIVGILVVLLVIVEYYKYYKIHKEGVK